jgi:hypothetical protein
MVQDYVTPSSVVTFDLGDIEALRSLFRLAYGTDFERIGDTSVPGYRDSITGSDGYLRTLLTRLYHRELLALTKPAFPTTLGELAHILGSTPTAEDDEGQQERAVLAMLEDGEDLPRHAAGFEEAGSPMGLDDLMDVLGSGAHGGRTWLSTDSAVIAVWRLQRGLDC